MEEELTFELFKSKSYLIIYNLLRSSEHTMPLRMLNNLGENISEHLHEISFNTMDSTLRYNTFQNYSSYQFPRNQLLRELRWSEVLNTDDTKLVEFMLNIEQVYTESKMGQIQASGENIEQHYLKIFPTGKQLALKII